MNRFIFVLALCLFSLFVSLPSQADEPEKVPSLNDAQTLNDVYAYILHEYDKIDSNADEKQKAAALADIYMNAYEKALEVAKADWEKIRAYSLKFAALRFQITAGIEEAGQKLETFLEELAAQEELVGFVNECRFTLFQDKALEAENTPENFDTFKSELKTWINRKIPIAMISRAGFVYVMNKSKSSIEQFAAELAGYVQSEECTLPAREKSQALNVIQAHETEFRFYSFAQKANETVNTPESFETFKTELKTFIGGEFSISNIADVGIEVAERNNVSAEQFIKELIEYVQLPECPLATAKKIKAVAALEGTLRTAPGHDPKLYGKTLDNQDFDWESLRGKYVLIKFTATWCGPCKGEIPGMLEAYQKYHDKGFEIISVHIWEHGTDPVETVKEHVEKEKLPWIIISEALTVAEPAEKSLWGNITGALGGKNGKPQGQGEYYGINGVPTMLLVDKEGKIMMKHARGEKLQTKLAEIFE